MARKHSEDLHASGLADSQASPDDSLSNVNIVFGAASAFGSQMFSIFNAIGVMMLLFGKYLYGKFVIRTKRGLTQLKERLYNWFRDFIAPFVKIFTAPGIILKNIKKYKDRSAFKVAFWTIGSGLRNNKGYVKALANYTLPVISIIAFTVLVQVATSSTYVVAVKMNNQTIGYVQDEKTFYQAKADLEAMITYEDEDSPYIISPTFELAVAEEEEILGQEEMTKTLMAMAGEDINNAVGFYVDGQFYGAVEDTAEIEEALQKILADNEAMALEQFPEANAEVSFVNDIEYREGYYLSTSLKAEDDVVELVFSDDGGKDTYVALDDEKLSLVAAKKAVEVQELKELNGLRSDVLASGQEISLPENTPLLNVKVELIDEYPTEEEFETIKTETDELMKGIEDLQIQGQNGMYQIKARIVYVNGKEVEREVLEKVTLQEKINKEILVGTRIESMDPNTVAQYIASGDGKFIRPMSTGYVSSYMGDRRNHQGFDIAAPTGTPIYASAAGVVTFVGYDGAYGNKIVVDHGDGFTTVYAHQSAFAVDVGREVEQGELIGYVGSTGRSTGPHLHFEIRYNGEYSDPGQYIGYE